MLDLLVPGVGMGGSDPAALPRRRQAAGNRHALPVPHPGNSRRGRVPLQSLTAAPIVPRRRVAAGAGKECPPCEGHQHRSRVPGSGLTAQPLPPPHRLAAAAIGVPRHGRVHRAKLPQQAAVATPALPRHRKAHGPAQLGPTPAPGQNHRGRLPALGLVTAPAPPLPNFRRSRKQFHHQLPAAPTGLTAAPVVPRHRVASTIQQQLPPGAGCSWRPRVPQTGQVVPSRLTRRHARSPAPPPAPGRSERRIVYHTGLGATPVVGRHRLARAPRPPAYPGSARRGTVYHSGLADHPIIPRHRLAHSPRPRPHSGRVRRGVQHGPNPPAGLIQRRLARQETFSPLLLLGAWHRQPLADTGAFPPPPVVCPYRPARVDASQRYLARPDTAAAASLNRPDECR